MVLIEYLNMLVSFPQRRIFYNFFFSPYQGGTHDRRAHHNALERRRRDHIKDSFSGLRDCIPSLVGEKVSRAHVLNKATEYIRRMQKSGSAREVTCWGKVEGGREGSGAEFG